MEYTNTSETMEIRIHGPHHAALRRRSVKVFDGAMTVLTIRAPSDTFSGVVGGAGVTGLADMSFSCADFARNSSRSERKRQAAWPTGRGISGCPSGGTRTETPSDKMG